MRCQYVLTCDLEEMQNSVGLLFLYDIYAVPLLLRLSLTQVKFSIKKFQRAIYSEQILQFQLTSSSDQYLSPSFKHESAQTPQSTNSQSHCGSQNSASHQQLAQWTSALLMKRPPAGFIVHLEPCLPKFWWRHCWASPFPFLWLAGRVLLGENASSSSTTWLGFLCWALVCSCEAALLIRANLNCWKFELLTQL